MLANNRFPEDQLGHQPPEAGTLQREANGCYTKYQQTENPKDLDDAIEMIRNCVNATAHDDPNLRKRKIDFMTMLASRYKQMQWEEDLREATELAERTVLNCETGHFSPFRALCLALYSQFELTREKLHLELAIQFGEWGASSDVLEDPYLWVWLMMLSQMLRDLFDCDGDVEYIDRAIDHIDTSMRLTPLEQTGSRSSQLFDRAISLHKRHVRTGNGDDLDKAIEEMRNLVTGDFQADIPRANVLGNLSDFLEDKYEATGDRKYLDESILRANEAIEQAAPEGKPKYYYCLGSRLLELYKLENRWEHLKRAIKFGKLAVDAIPPGDPAFPSYSNVLGLAFFRQSLKTEDMKDLVEAIHYLGEAVRETPRESQWHAKLTLNFCEALSYKADLTSDKEEALEVLDGVIQSLKAQTLSDDDPLFQLLQHRKANALMDRFKLSGKQNLRDFADALEADKRVIDGLPIGSAKRALMQFSYGLDLLESTDTSLENDAIETFLKAFERRALLPRCRVESAFRCLPLLEKHERWAEANAMAKEALQLLTMLMSRYLTSEDQRYTLSQIPGLASKCCSLSLHRGESPAEALKLLETGRGSIMALILESRQHLSKLRASNPQKADEIERLLLAAKGSSSAGKDLFTDFERELKATAKLNQCIEEVRTLETFEGHRNFLRNEVDDDLRQHAAEGPIIVVNVSSIRSDAILVTPSQPVDSVSLPGLTMQAIGNWFMTELIVWTTLEECGKKNKLFIKFQKWLWKECVEPILDRLKRCSDWNRWQKPLRVWWIGVHIASLLPFHAAGDHNPGSTQNTLSHVISSYAPTIRALAHTRERNITALGHKSEGKAKLLFATMPTTPGGTELPGVVIEALRIHLAVRDKMDSRVLVGPTAATVLNQLKDFHIVHFSCHGESNSKNPFKSRLVLQKLDGSGSPQQDSLTVQQISDTDLQLARIAFLSACSTAQILEANLIDEVLHLASGFQVAGFSHVIGSMWLSKENICVELANQFYLSLIRSQHLDHGKPRDVAEALHRAVLKIRDMDNNHRKPLFWAQFIHFGA